MGNYCLTPDTPSIAEPPWYTPERRRLITLAERSARMSIDAVVAMKELENARVAARRAADAARKIWISVMAEMEAARRATLADFLDISSLTPPTESFVRNKNDTETRRFKEVSAAVKAATEADIEWQKLTTKVKVISIRSAWAAAMVWKAAMKVDPVAAHMARENLCDSIRACRRILVYRDIIF